MSFATIAEADREYAINVGSERRDVCWIVSDRDVIYRNPFYTGPVVAHPDDDQYNDIAPFVGPRTESDAASIAALYDDIDF